MASVAIITARGGSKRIPGKNIKQFCGKPIIAYSIEAAIESRMFDEVMVSTDSKEIAETARRYGAKVPFLRSENNSNDLATTADVILEVLGEYEKMGMDYGMFCCIYPTAPLITAEKIRNAVLQLESADAYSLIAVVAYSFPPQRAFVIDKGILKYQYPENERVRSQDLEKIYHDSGQFYVCKTDEFTRCRSLITSKTIPFIMDEKEVQDIDTETDWKIAEMKYKVMQEP